MQPFIQNSKNLETHLHLILGNKWDQDINKYLLEEVQRGDKSRPM